VRKLLSARSRFWVLTAATATGIWVTASLGLWQLGRAEEKAQLQAAIDTRRLLPPLSDAALTGNGSAEPELLHRLIVLRGSWLPRHTVLLDNRQMFGKVGFFVLTPLVLEHSGTAVVVQRGWVQRSFVDRAQVPELPTPAGLVEVRGRIAPPPAKLYEFAGAPGGLIRQNVDLAGFAQEVGMPLAAFSVLQLGSASDGLAREWPAVSTGIDKHHGYAFQWFALCVLIVILYGWFQIVRPLLRPR